MFKSLFDLIKLVILQIFGVIMSVIDYFTSSNKKSQLLIEFQRHAYYVQLLKEIRLISNKISESECDLEWKKNVSNQIILGGGSDANSEEVNYFFENRETLENKVMRRIKESLDDLRRERERNKKEN